MRKKLLAICSLSIVIIIIIVIIITVSNNKETYTIEAVSGHDWKFNGGTFADYGDEQRLKYNLQYIGTEDLYNSDLSYDFYILLEDKSKGMESDLGEPLYSNITMHWLNNKPDSKNIKKDSWKGSTLDTNKVYDYTHLMLKINYSNEKEEILELPMIKN